MNYSSLFKETLRDFARRFWIYGLILYIATVMVELFRQVLLENLATLRYLTFGNALFLNGITKELLANPVLFFVIALLIFFWMWGFVSLYFALSGQGLKSSVANGLKRLPLYTGFVLIASFLTLLGFTIISIPALTYLQNYSLALPPLTSGAPAILSVLILLVLCFPGIYLLVSFSNAPFILLLEKSGIKRALLESHRRVSAQRLDSAIFLAAALAISTFAFYFLIWLIFTLKLAFVPDLSLRGESMLRVFFYSIPWVVAAAFFDLAVFHLYKKLRDNTPILSSGAETKYAEKGKEPLIPPAAMKIIAVTLLLTFTLTFGVIPLPAQAGGVVGLVLGTIVGIISCVAGCFGLGFIMSTIVGSLISTTVGFISSTITGTQTLLGGAVFCEGKFDPVWGTCKSEKQEIQISNTSLDVKFLKIAFDEIPTPEEFNANPSIKNQTKMSWKADAPLGVREYIKVEDLDTKEVLYGSSVRTCTNPAQHAPVGIPAAADDTLALPYGHKFKASIDFEMCIHLKAPSKKPELLCVFGDDGINKLNNLGVFNGPGKTAGCGCDPALLKFGVTPCGTLVYKEFSTPELPVSVKIKAGAAQKNKPVTLSWTTQYATSCTAEGSWSGSKPINGSEIVIPTQGNEVYTLNCNGAKDSVSLSADSATPGSLKIFNSPSIDLGGGSGSLGSLKIVEFNISNPLNPGATINISWSVSGAKKCEVDNGIGQIPCVGSADVTFLKTITFTLTGTDEQGNQVSAKKTVNVKKAPFFREIIPE